MCSMKRCKAYLCFGILISLIFITSSFAQKKQSVWGDAKPGFILSYRPNLGDFYIYERTTEGTNTMERMGQSLETTNSTKFVFQLETEQVDSLIRFVMTVDTIGYLFGGPQGNQAMDFGDIKGKKVHATMTSKGEGRDIVPIDSLPVPKMGDRTIEGDVKGWLTVQLFKVPDKPIKISDTWTEAKRDTNTHTDTTRQSTVTVINDSKAKYTVLGEEAKMGLTCLHIQVETEYSRQSIGKMKDTEISTDGDGETTTHAWFAYKEGILMEYSTSDFYEGTTVLSGQMNMTSPNTRETKSSSKLVKWIPVKK
jgi:hypothetical protein